MAPRSPHPPVGRTFARVGACLALVSVLVGLAAHPSLATVEGLTAVIGVECDRDSSPESALVSVVATNRTAQTHSVVLELTNQPDLVTAVGPGTPGNPTSAIGTMRIPSSEWTGTFTAGVRVGIGSSYIYGPFDYTNPCSWNSDDDSHPSVTVSEVKVFCNRDEAEPRLMLNASLDNAGADPEDVRFELSGRNGATITIKGEYWLTFGTWWTMAEAGDEVEVVVWLDSLDLVLFEGTFPNVCIHQPEPETPEVEAEEPAPHVGADPAESVLESVMPVEPVGAVDGPAVASLAAEVSSGTLPRTGATTAALAVLAVCVLLTGLALVRTAGTQRSF